MSKNYRTTAAKVTAELSTHSELNTHLEDPVSLQIIREKLQKSNIYSTAAIATPLITENNAERRERWYDDHKTRTSDDWKYAIWSDESFFTVFPTSDRVCVWRTPKEAIIQNAWFQLQNTETHPWRFGQNFDIPFVLWLLWMIQLLPVDTLGNLVNPQVQTLVRDNEANFSRWSFTHSHTARSVDLLVWGVWRCISTSSLASTIARLKYHRTTAVSVGEQGEKLNPFSIISPATRRCFARRVLQYSTGDYSELHAFFLHRAL